jgi:hypothetical protein
MIEKALEGKAIFTQTLTDKYNKDPSQFCRDAWYFLGPNGTYKRQMLEAK